jgi:hypothetical protein
LQKLNWHPTVELKVQRYELEQRMLQMRKEDERLKKEDERLDELSSKLRAILSRSDTSSTPPNSTHDWSEM